MAPQVQASRVLQFGAFEVDPARGELRQECAASSFMDTFQIYSCCGRRATVLTREDCAEVVAADTFRRFRQRA